MKNNIGILMTKIKNYNFLQKGNYFISQASFYEIKARSFSKSGFFGKIAMMLRDCENWPIGKQSVNFMNQNES